MQICCPICKPVRVHPGCDVDDRLYSSVKAVGKAGRRYRRPGSCRKPPGQKPGLELEQEHESLARSANYRSGIHVGVGGNQGVNGDPETPGNTEEGIAGPDCIEKAPGTLRAWARPGYRSAWPIWRLLGLTPGLAFIIACTVVLKRAARLKRCPRADRVDSTAGTWHLGRENIIQKTSPLLYRAMY